MRLTKRILCLALVLALTFALCACGEKEPANDDTTPTTSTTANSEGGNLEGDNIFNDAELDWG